MKKSACILEVFSIILLAANFVFSGETVEYPRYIPPAQTRDEIIQEELRKQQAQDRFIIRFAAGEAAVKPEYEKAIADLAGYLNDHPEAAASINGYTDNAGTPAANLKLSERRAREVKEILVKEFNIDGSRLETVGWGAKKPLASNKTTSGRQKNRRVEAVIVSK